MFVNPIKAASYSWTGGAGTTNWQDNGNWNISGYPVDNDNVTISKSGSPITISIPSTISTLANFTTSNIELVFNSSITLTGAVSFTSTTFSPTGSLSISNSSTISITSSVFDIDLTIVNTATSNPATTVTSSSFNELFDLTGNSIKLTYNTFGSTTNILKKGTNFVNYPDNHDNTFDGVTSVSHEEGGVFYFGNNNDVFNGDVTFDNKSGAQVMAVGYSSLYAAPTIFHGKSEFINNSATSIFYVSNPSTSHVIFDADTKDSIEVIFRNNSTNYLYIGNAGAIDFIKSKVHVISTATPSPSQPSIGTMQIGLGLTSTGNRVVFDEESNLYTDQLTVPFSMKAVTFKGQYTSGVTITPDTLRLLGNAYSFSVGQYCVFDRDVKVDLLKLNGLYGTYNGKAVIVQRSNDGNLVGSFYNSLVFNNDVLFHYKYTASSGGSWNLMGHLTNNSQWAEFNNKAYGDTSVVMIYTESASPIYFGYLYGDINFNGVKVVIARKNTSTGNVYFGYNCNLNLNESNVVLIQTSNANVYFGNTGTVTMDGGIFNGNSVDNGSIWFNRFVAKENIAVASISGSANFTTYYIGPNATFDKNLTLTAPNFYIKGAWFKGDTELYKYNITGAIDNFMGGNCVADGDFLITNASTRYIVIGTNSSENYTFNGNVTCRRLNTGELRLVRIGTYVFKGDFTYEGNFVSTPYGDGGAYCIFNGLTDQTISHTSSSSFPFIITKLEVNKTSGALIIENPVKIVKNGSVTGVLSLSKGNIQTAMDGSTLTSTLALGDDATVSGGGKHSFVDGPLSKIGNDAFKFFIGKGVKYFPASISAPSATNATFTAEFMDTYQPQGTSLDNGLKDAINCQYWKIDKVNTSNPVNVTLFWNNEAGQICYPVNHNLVCVARYNSGTTSWENEGRSIVHDYNPTADSGYVASTTSYTSMGYFALGYNNALVLNTQHVNPTKFKVYNHMEPLDAFSVYPFTSGPEGSAAGDKTILSSLKNIPGSIVIHPDFESTVDLQIDRSLSGSVTDVKAGYANYLPLEGKIHTTASGSADVVDEVEIDEDGDDTFLPLLGDVHAISGNTLFFYKEKLALETFDLSNNLEDALTYTVNRYLTTPYTPFQITSSVPSGYSATLKIYDSSDSNFYTNTTDLKWDGKVSATEFYPEGFYRYEVILSNGSTTKTYNAQLVLKHQ